MKAKWCNNCDFLKSYDLLFGVFEIGETPTLKQLFVTCCVFKGCINRPTSNNFQAALSQKPFEKSLVPTGTTHLPGGCEMMRATGTTVQRAGVTITPTHDSRVDDAKVI